MSLPWFVFRHVEIEGLGTLATLMERKEIPYRYVDLFRGELVPDHLDGIGGLIVMGGPMNVDEEERFPFLREETRFLRQALAQEIPILGICLGSQLIAKAAGARVYKGSQKEIGWKPLTFTEAGTVDPLFEGFAGGCMAFHWHGDTFDLPDGAVHLCRSDLYRHQAFRIGTRVYAFQFHLEVDRPMIREWLSDLENQQEMAVAGVTSAEILEGIERYGKEFEAMGARVFERFFRSVR
jgi:GMP synthase (glutamine-hydrolysing)